MPQYLAIGFAGLIGPIATLFLAYIGLKAMKVNVNPMSKEGRHGLLKVVTGGGALGLTDLDSITTRGRQLRDWNDRRRHPERWKRSKNNQWVRSGDVKLQRPGAGGRRAGGAESRDREEAKLEAQAVKMAPKTASGALDGAEISMELAGVDSTDQNRRQAEKMNDEQAHVDAAAALIDATREQAYLSGAGRIKQGQLQRKVDKFAALSHDDKLRYAKKMRSKRKRMARREFDVQVDFQRDELARRNARELIERRSELAEQVFERNLDVEDTLMQEALDDGNLWLDDFTGTWFDTRDGSVSEAYTAKRVSAADVDLRQQQRTLEAEVAHVKADAASRQVEIAEQSAAAADDFKARRPRAFAAQQSRRAEFNSGDDDARRQMNEDQFRRLAERRAKRNGMGTRGRES